MTESLKDDIVVLINRHGMKEIVAAQWAAKEVITL
jgi:hypothetical protein